ncbi:hypothetical protein D9757_005209 [Collybiopsis confluens]|uniref:Uncharacterized protein n=1 Tax=Collybiopsis confluens TaxID=2823264 RepID=A0A8H5HWA4_9AGAR|nr:hypothetical protein D9757_005209 [Collybiopsis confluens]
MDNLLQLLTSKSETLAAKELEKALNEGFASLSKRTPIAPNPSDRQAYSDLKAYVDAGKDFPTTPAKFEEQAPQSVFQ